MATDVTDSVVQCRLAHAKVVYLPEERLLIDTGPQPQRDELESFIESSAGVDRLFVSHAHGDHVGNVGWVVETYDPDVYYPESEPLDDTPLSADDVTRVTDGDSLGDSVRVVEVPGHTPGICALYLPDDRTLLATDVLDGSDRRGLPQGYLVPPPAVYNWDSELAETNLDQLLDLEFDRAVVTHGSNVTAEPRRKLDEFLNFTDHYRQRLLE